MFLEDESVLDEADAKKPQYRKELALKKSADG
jgi:hypothetical protein